MSMAVHMMRWDATLQYRSHVYAATMVATAAICVVVLLIPLDPIPAKIAALLIFVDPAVIGLSFVGGFIAIERGAGTLIALGVTPMPGWVYVVSKIATFSALGVVSGGAIALVAAGAGLNAPMMVFALILTNAAAVVIGFLMVARTRSINGFIRNLVIFAMIAMAPVIGYFGLAPGPLDIVLRAIPTYAMLIVLEAGFDAGAVSTGDLVYAILFLLIVIAAGLKRAVSDYDRWIVTGGL